MPKEQTHWILAQRAFHALEDGKVRRMIARNSNLYLLGAVIPDTPMYALQNVAEYMELAQKLHGKSGENTFAPLAQLLECYQNRWSNGMWAFVLGTMSHILADAVYHPWVEFYTGSSTDVPEEERLLSLARHRELESYLDLYHVRKSRRFKARTFFSLLRAKEMRARDFDRMVTTLYFNSHAHKKNGINRVFMAHGAIQWILMRKSLSRVGHAVNGILNRKGDAWITLFYPYEEPQNPDYFSQGIQYRHTVTGRPKTGTVDALSAKATRITTRMFQLVEKHMEQDSVLDFFQRIKGPSLETGLVGVPTSAVVYYDLETSLDKILGVERVVK